MLERLAYFAPPTPRVIAHRGLALEAPENTLLAFAHAVGIGITHIETDVHVSADGVAIVAHDPDLSRVGGVSTRVDVLTARELAEIDLGDGQHMPTLAEALDGFPDAFFNIDLKTIGAVAPTVEAEIDDAAKIAKGEPRERLGKRIGRAVLGIATGIFLWKRR
jgi:glycerophosphoryl diester phosphodiesterase